MITFDTYEPGDVAKLDIRDGDLFEATFVEPPLPAWTMKDNGMPIACGGIMDQGHGLGVVWMFVSDGARGHGRDLYRFSTNALEFAENELGMYRIHTLVRTDVPEYLRWAQLFGFDLEGRLVKAAPDRRDVYLLARVH